MEQRVDDLTGENHKAAVLLHDEEEKGMISDEVGDVIVRHGAAQDLSNRACSSHGPFLVHKVGFFYVAKFDA